MIDRADRRGYRAEACDDCGEPAEQFETFAPGTRMWDAVGLLKRRDARLCPECVNYRRELLNMDRRAAR